jgi:hypothetical protein
MTSRINCAIGLLWLLFSACFADRKVPGTYVYFSQDSSITFNYRELQIDGNLGCRYFVARKVISSDGDTLTDEGSGFLRYVGSLETRNGQYTATLKLSESALVNVNDSASTFSLSFLSNDTILSDKGYRFSKIR